VQDPVPLLIGGGNPRLLDYATTHAHTIGFTGLGATLSDGHGHETRWSPADVDTLFGPFRSRRGPRVDVLVQHVELTTDRTAAAATVAEELDGTSAEDLLSAPFVLIGTEEEILAQIRRQATTLGAESYCVRGTALQDLAPIVQTLLTEVDERPTS
jgi:alkanesulfonate monooxygenase SsuD/methylene tetrahydromethanopterin reductase-like flavin-dependent oxidoreductase (luciferase family)